MHLTSAPNFAMGSYAIVGAQLCIALGAAWTAQYKETQQVAVCFFGDGTTNIGAFHEALNLAAVWKLPVVFVCENNMYMEYTAIADVTAVRRPAADRAGAYGLEAIHNRRQRRRHVFPRGAVGLRQRTRRRRPGADRGTDLPPRRPLAGRSRAVPARGRGRRMARARPDPALPRAAAARRRRRRGIWTASRRRRTTRSTARPKRRRAGRRRRPRRSSPTCGPTAVPHGGTDLSRSGRRRDRARDGAGRERRLLGRGRGRRGRRLQSLGRIARAFRSVARPRHADLRVGDPGRRDGRGDDRLAADRRDHVLRLSAPCVGTFPPTRSPRRAI